MMIFLVSVCSVSWHQLAYLAEKAGLCLTGSQSSENDYSIWPNAIFREIYSISKLNIIIQKNR